MKGKITLAHLVLILSFIILAIILGFYAYSHKDTRFGMISLNFAVALATATMVDLVYNYVIMEDVEEMIAKHLMLNRDVQKEIMRREKVDEILALSLENIIGQKLAIALKKSIIDKLATEKDLFLMERAYYSVTLKNFTDAPLKDFFEIKMTSKFNMTLKNNKAIFYATDNDKMYEKLVQKSNDPSIYLIYYLPAKCGKILKSNDSLLNKFFEIQELRIDGNNVTESKIESLYDNGTVTIKVDFDIPNDILAATGNPARISFRLKSLLLKYEHIFFRVIPRAYPSIFMSWDCVGTDIENVEVYHSFIGAQPEIERLLPNGKRINIIVQDWVLPNNMLIFIWKLKGEEE